MAITNNINYKGLQIDNAYIKIESLRIDNDTKATTVVLSVKVSDELTFNTAYITRLQGNEYTIATAYEALKELSSSELVLANLIEGGSDS